MTIIEAMASWVKQSIKNKSTEVYYCVLNSMIVCNEMLVFLDDYLQLDE